MSLHAWGLDPHKHLHQYVQRNWTVKDGLPLDAVRAILQTSDGFVWIGTHEGVVRFDGEYFERFDPPEAPSLKNAIISNLVEDRQGAVWLAGEYNLFRYWDGVFTEYDALDVYSIGITVIAEDRNGDLLVGTFEGLWRLVGKTAPLQPVPEMEHERVLSILSTRQGNFWIGTSAGLVELEVADRPKRRLTIADGLSDNKVTALLQDPSGTMWIGTGSGLNLLRGGTVQSIAELQGQKIYCLAADPQGNVWVATKNNGLFYRHRGRFLHFTADPRLTAQTDWALAVDRESNLWVGSFEGGLDLFTDGNVTTFTAQDGLTNEFVWGLAPDGPHRLWVNTSGGLFHYEDRRLTLRGDASSTATHALTTYTATRSGDVWVGTVGRGLLRLERGRSSSITADRLFPKSNISVAYEDRVGALWVGTRDDGLYRFKGDKLDRYRKADGLPSDYISGIREDSAGRLWIATPNGLALFEEGRIRTLDDKKGRRFTSLYIDRDDTLWLGTLAAGLQVYRHGTFATISTDHGYANDTVLSILEDDHGCLWTGTNVIKRQ